MEYTNIKSNLSFVQSKDKIYKKNELLLQFENFIKDSGYEVKKWINKKKAPYELLLVDDNQKMIHLIVYLKNVTGAGWREKPYIKRTQVSNIRVVSPDNYVGTSRSETMVILGYYNFDDNPIMIGWDAYRYVKHKTMRSCYVTVDVLKKGYQSGYFVGNSSSQKVWIFKSNYFDKFIKDYIQYNSNEGK